MKIEVNETFEALWDFAFALLWFLSFGFPRRPSRAFRPVTSWPRQSELSGLAYRGLLYIVTKIGGLLRLGGGFEDCLRLILKAFDPIV